MALRIAVKPFFAIVAVMGLSAAAEIKLGVPFADGMVLQRARAVPVWGTADPGAKVAVEFAGQKRETVAKADGTWRINLAPLEASKEGRILAATV